MENKTNNIDKEKPKGNSFFTVKPIDDKKILNISIVNLSLLAVLFGTGYVIYLFSNNGVSGLEFVTIILIPFYMVSFGAIIASVLYFPIALLQKTLQSKAKIIGGISFIVSIALLVRMLLSILK